MTLMAPAAFYANHSLYSLYSCQANSHCTQGNLHGFFVVLNHYNLISFQWFLPKKIHSVAFTQFCQINSHCTHCSLHGFFATVIHNNLDGFHRILHWKLVLHPLWFLPLYFTTISLVCNNFWWCYLNFDNKNMCIFHGNYFLQSKKALVFSLNVRNNINQKTMLFCTVFCRKNHPNRRQFSMHFCNYS